MLLVSCQWRILQAPQQRQRWDRLLDGHSYSASLREGGMVKMSFENAEKLKSSRRYGGPQ